MDAGTVKKLFEGKKGKIMLAAGAGIAVMGVIALRHKSQGTVTAYDTYPAVDVPTQASPSGGSSAGSASGGVSADEVSKLLTQYSSSVSDQLKKQQDAQSAFNSSIVGAVNNALAAVQTGYESTFSGLSKQVSDLNAQVHSGLQERASQLVSVDYHDNTDYNSSHPTASNAATSNVQPHFGYGGADYNTASRDVQKGIENLSERLATDTAFRASERERTLNVIEERRKAGKDTTEQFAYLGTLREMGR